MSVYPQDFSRGTGNGMSGSGTIIGFIAGAAIGAGVALLLAPATGVETRRRLGRTATRLGSSMKDGVAFARERMGSVTKDVRNAVSSGRDAYAREREARPETPVNPQY